MTPRCTQPGPPPARPEWRSLWSIPTSFVAACLAAPTAARPVGLTAGAVEVQLGDPAHLDGCFARAFGRPRNGLGGNQVLWTDLDAASFLVAVCAGVALPLGGNGATHVSLVAVLHEREGVGVGGMQKLHIVEPNNQGGDRTRQCHVPDLIEEAADSAVEHRNERCAGG